MKATGVFLLLVFLEWWRAERDRTAALDAALDAEFDRALVPLLTPEQRTCYAAFQKRLADRRAKGQAAIAAETAPFQSASPNFAAYEASR